MSLGETLAALTDLNKPLLRAQLRELSNIGAEDFVGFKELWQGLPAERRSTTARLLDELAEENVDLDFRTLFTYFLHDEDPQVRVTAIDGLWEDESLTLMQELIQMLHDPSGDVRTAAALGLSRFAYLAEIEELPESAASQLHQALFQTSIDPEQPLEARRRSIEALGYFANSAEAQAEIGRAYAHSEQLMRESALVAMGRSMRPTWFPYIERELRAPSPALRYEAARAVGELGEEGKALLTGLISLVDDDDNEVATMAIWALGQVGGSSAKRVLERLVRSRDEARRQAASEALEELALEEF